jgi:hypothetical protein
VRLVITNCHLNDSQKVKSALAHNLSHANLRSKCLPSLLDTNLPVPCPIKTSAPANTTLANAARGRLRNIIHPRGLAQLSPLDAAALRNAAVSNIPDPQPHINIYINQYPRPSNNSTYYPQTKLNDYTTYVSVQFLISYKS